MHFIKVACTFINANYTKKLKKKTLEYLRIFFSYCFKYHIRWVTFLREHFPEPLISIRGYLKWQVATQASPFPRFVSLWVPIYPLMFWWGSWQTPEISLCSLYGQYTVWPSCSLPWNDPHQRTNEYIGTHKGTNQGNELALQITPHWNEALREMVSSKASPTWYDIQNCVKKNSKMF